MKRILLLLIFGVLLSGGIACDKNRWNNDQINADNIVGSWQLIQQITSDGANIVTKDISSGYTLSFEENNKLKISAYPCDGKYSITNNSSLSLDMDCTPNVQINPGILPVSNITFRGKDTIVLRGTDCDEPCGQVYKRIISTTQRSIL